MTVNKRAKMSRARGSWTHGWGAKKKHRGAGHRVGRGNAGSGKKGDARSPTYVRIRKYFGKHGFTSRSRSLIIPVNVGYFDQYADDLVLAKKVMLKDDTYHVDCTKLGFGKLLSKGPVTRKFSVTVSRASPKAIAKVEAAGGSVTVEDAILAESSSGDA